MKEKDSVKLLLAALALDHEPNARANEESNPIVWWHPIRLRVLLKNVMVSSRRSGIM